jgi:hypothetical protein
MHEALKLYRTNYYLGNKGCYEIYHFILLYHGLFEEAFSVGKKLKWANMNLGIDLIK